MGPSFARLHTRNIVHQSLIALVVVFLLQSQSFAESRELPSAELARHFADGVMGSVAADNNSGTLQQLQEALALPEARAKDFENQLSVNFTNTIVQLGYAQGYEFIRQARVGEFLMRLTYVARYERGAARWLFVFYKRGQTWKLLDVRTDSNLQALFDREG
jgi:hypothetical protein